MKNLVIEVIKKKWGDGPTSWLSTEWKVYDDLTVVIKSEYSAKDEDEKYKVKETKISKRILKSMIKKIKKAKDEDKIVRAYDGVAWEITFYEESKESWRRELGHIYGIESLEKLASILEKIK